MPSDGDALSYRKYSPGYFTDVHVLTVNPEEHLIVPVKAIGEKKRETVLALADRYGAVAGINGGFWKPNGDPAGILKIAGHLYGTAVKPRGAIGWSPGVRNALIDRVLTRVGSNVFDGMIETYVISASVPPRTTSEEWKQRENIVGGAPVLIRAGVPVVDYTSEQMLKSFIVKKYSRTAVGIKENGDWVFVVVAGRLFGLLGGMTLPELADTMLILGCVEAVNLDGGRSSAMTFEGKTVNYTYGSVREKGKLTQPVSDAILIFPSGFEFRDH